MEKKTYRAGQNRETEPLRDIPAHPAPPPVRLPSQNNGQSTQKKAGLRLPPADAPGPARPRRKKWPVVVALLLAAMLGTGAGGGLALWLRAGGVFPAKTESGVSGEPIAGIGSPSEAKSAPPVFSEPGGQAAQTVDELIANAVPNTYRALPLPGEMRAMWFSYLEWMDMSFSSETEFRTEMASRIGVCADMGLNTLLVMVRPFSDALYQSDVFPWSHVISGTQGQAPGFDPLAVMAEEAHAAGLRLEAWLNPYRVSLPSMGPAVLNSANPAAQNPGWVRSVNNEAWYDPGLPEVEQLVVRGVLEIVQNYHVDGIHFDDYFYPAGIDESFDAGTYAAYGQGQPLTEWRLANINRTVAAVKRAVLAANPTASFGVSVQGNNAANYNQMYADVNRWLAEDGFADYIMPQIYWGFGHVDAQGRTDAAFDKRAAEWAAHTRAASVRLYCGLAAYRIGLLQPGGSRSEFGGNGYGDNSEWESGHALADQVAHLRQTEAFTGFALFRYDFMVQPGDAVSAAEIQALTQLCTEE